jgi:hypothetical protein
MKTFLCEYESVNNLFQGTAVIKAETLQAAQTNFLEWLKKQDVYPHMWRLTFSFKEVDSI